MATKKTISKRAGATKAGAKKAVKAGAKKATKAGAKKGAPVALRLSPRFNEARMKLDALIGRASYDADFVKALKADPQATLAANGLLNNKRDVEAFVKAHPKEFDRIGEAMISGLGEDFWAQAGVMASTCDPVPN